jgi:hypothetical protein
MGRSVTPPVRVEIVDQSGYKWQTAFPFKPTFQNFVSWINTFDESVLRGVNAHLGADSVIASARLVSQRKVNRGEILQSYKRD